MGAKSLPGLVSLTALFLTVFFRSLSAQSSQNSAATHPAKLLAQFKNAAPGVAYAGSKVCAECHADIYESYLRTDMGRAMSRPGDRKELEGLDPRVKVKHPKANRYYEVYRRGPNLCQSEYELNAEGQEVFRDEHKIDYIIGSGSNGFSCIVRRGDFLFEAPLSYYSAARAWGLSPGYEEADYAFSRPIQADCISCHSGRPQPIESSEGRFGDPAFLELSIGCESCHGPGALHVEERRRAAALTGPMDRSIVNPAKLPGWLADNICMYCHQGLDATALMPGKQYADFRPGTPLADTLAVFAVPFSSDRPPADPMLQHFVLMKLSRCYSKSAGRLSCITCHDPHRQPTAGEAAPYFRTKCLACHAEKGCSLPAEVRNAKTPPDDCAGCHMPKQRLQEISHSSLTNHRILLRPGEPLPENAFHPTTPELPDLVFLNVPPESLRKPIPLLTLFRAYGELMTSHQEYRARFDSVLNSLAKANSQDALVLSTLAMNKMSEGSAESQAAAEDYFQRALRAGSANARDFELLATVQANAARAQDSIATVKRGLKVNPYSPRLYHLMAELYISIGAREDALKTMKEDLELFPEDTFMRSLIERVENENGGGSSHREDPR
jgi:hypothetical protein